MSTSTPLTYAHFTAQRQQIAGQYFPHPAGKATVLVSSHIWWTDQIAYAVYALGYNVLLGQPFYMLYTENNAFALFDNLYEEWLTEIKRREVALIIAGNSTAMAPHPKTGIMLHDAAGVPVVNYWWDEPRTCPPYARRLGLGPDAFLAHLKNPHALNVIWDIDVLEELAAFNGIRNTLHVPLATLPEHWPQRRIALRDRPIDCCFLGNCHFVADYADTSTDPLVVWANKVVARKLENLDRPMTACLTDVGPHPAPPANDPWQAAFFQWEVLNAVYMHRTRNLMVASAAEHLQGRLALIGTGWDKVGLRTNAPHAAANTGHVYASSKASLNLFGGCVHGGMPLRPFDIAASFGLILTHYNRELPDLFEPGKECLAFRNAEEMTSLLDQVASDPTRFEPVLEAGHNRAMAKHGWTQRMQCVLAAARDKLGAKV